MFTIRRAHREGHQMRVRDHLVDRPARQDLAEGDIGDLVAALGFVHVMGGDKDGETVGREFVNLAPELAPRLGVDARGRLVEQQQTWIGQRAGAERKPLFPAAGEFSCDLLLTALQAEPRDHRVRRRRRPLHAVDARDEFEVLAHREIVVEAEALRHVTDAVLDLHRLGANVVAETGAVACIGRQ